MTDEDVYGKTLGKPFKGVRAELCRPEADVDDVTARVARYLFNRFFRGSPTLRERLRRACAALDGGGNLFSRQNVANDLAAASTDSLVAQNVARAYARANTERADGRTFLGYLAEACAADVRALLAVQSGYRDDAAGRDAFERFMPAVIRRLTDEFSRTCRLQNAPASTLAQHAPEHLLDFVVATAP